MRASVTDDRYTHIRNIYIQTAEKEKKRQKALKLKAWAQRDKCSQQKIQVEIRFKVSCRSAEAFGGSNDRWG